MCFTCHSALIEGLNLWMVESLFTFSSEVPCWAPRVFSIMFPKEQKRGELEKSRKESMRDRGGRKEKTDWGTRERWRF